VKGILEGLCQAMNPKMKTIIAPALTASVNSGLRPPATESSTMLTGSQNCLRKPKERQEVRLTKGAWSFRGTASQQGIGGLSTFKTWFRPGPSAVSPARPILAIALGPYRGEIALGGRSACCGAGTRPRCRSQTQSGAPVALLSSGSESNASGEAQDRPKNGAGHGHETPAK
jgi:hypothetical protein